MEYPYSLALLYLPLYMSNLVDMLTGRQVDKYGIPIMLDLIYLTLVLSTLVALLWSVYVSTSKIC